MLLSKIFMIVKMKETESNVWAKLSHCSSWVKLSFVFHLRVRGT